MNKHYNPRFPSLSFIWKPVYYYFYPLQWRVSIPNALHSPTSAGNRSALSTLPSSRAEIGQFAYMKTAQKHLIVQQARGKT